MAKLVIKIGRKRAEASKMASYFDFPCSQVGSQIRLSKFRFLVTSPIKHDGSNLTKNIPCLTK